MATPRTLVAVAIGAALVLATPALAGFTATDVIVPSLGKGPGAAGSSWNGCIWVHNPNAAPVNVTFRLLLRNQPNPSAQAFHDTIPPGDTRRYDDVFATMFGVHLATYGAVRVTANAPVLVNARSYSTPAGGRADDTVGQFYSAIPTSFAIGVGQTAQLLGVYQTNPQEASLFRYNYGFVESSGQAATVQVTALDETGAVSASKSYSVGGFEARQYNVTDLLPAVNATNLRLQLTVTSGPGKVVAFGSGIANRSNDPSTFEMSFRDSLLAGSGGGLTAVTHNGTLTGDGTLSSPLGIANGGVGKTQLAAPGGTSGQVLGTNGSALVWQNAGSGGLSSIAHDGTLAGEGSSSSPLGIANGGVGKTQLAAPGGTSGQVLGTNGSALVWQNAGSGGLTLPYKGTTNSSMPAIDVTNQGNGHGVAGVGGLSGVFGFSSGGSGVVGRSDTSAGVTGNSNTGPGVHGYSATSAGVVGDSAADVGVHGLSTTGNGVSGQSGSGRGVFGTSNNGPGVHGHSATSAGVVGDSAADVGVHGISTTGEGVVGDSTGGSGVMGASTGTGKAGIYGVNSNPNGYAGLFQGHTRVVSGFFSVEGLSGPVCATAGGVLDGCPSDGRLKKNVRDLSSEVDVLDALSLLRGVTFDWDTSVERAKDMGDRREMGLIAQEVEPVLPELVLIGRDGYRTLDYSRMVAFLVEVGKAQQARIGALEAELETLQAAVRRLEAQSEETAHDRKAP
ncbi:MAG: tail fiber domain-containing protein [Thermoanaerobaculaceae bacterium]|nr:tail fiber domain-containing protein [Thermoanaerobaculaceae bacterium]MDI9622928.1 tail fiber domain-containing protein [Acidobacteriota bacterium]